MRVIIEDKFYEFQNPKTEDFFKEQKAYLAQIIKECEHNDDYERLLTTLLSLYNLSEALLHEIVEKNGLEKTIEALNAKSVD